jgi:hypothetical protein
MVRIMMNQRIIYKNLENYVCVIIPTPEALQTMTIEEIAAKDVPQGIEYKIIDASELPQDRTFRNAWTWQE